MDLDGGTGFDREFLTDAVNPPGCNPAELLVVDGQVEIPYMHFSLAMHADRRLARWVAWNIDGMTRWDGDDIPRDGMRFVPDPRVPVDEQTTEAVYTGNRLDRGHLARRADPVAHETTLSQNLAYEVIPRNHLGRDRPSSLEMDGGQGRLGVVCRRRRPRRSSRPTRSPQPGRYRQGIPRPGEAMVGSGPP